MLPDTLSKFLQLYENKKLHEYNTRGSGKIHMKKQSHYKKTKMP